MEFFGSQLAGVWAVRIVSVVLGGTAGFLYYKFIGCKTGACPLTGNPWISTLYGAFIGWMIVAR
jgi:Family of unknown function (DUF6132)